MASFASVTEGRAIHSKYRGIRLKVSATTSAADIVEALLEKCHVDEIETVQPMPGRGNWIVVFAQEELVNTCLIGLNINGEKILPTRVAKERYTYASVLYVPPDISNDEIAMALSEFTEVKNIKHQYMADYPGIMTGKRLVILKPRDDLPAYFDVQGTRATLLFSGRVACCPYCDKTDHLGRDCPNKRARKLCYHCREYGHFRRDCPNRAPQMEVERPANTDHAPPAAPQQDSEDQEAEQNVTEQAEHAEQIQPAVEENAETPPDNTPPASASQLSETPDISFVSQDTPLLFSAATQDSEKTPSPPMVNGRFSDMVFTIPASEDFTFTPPEKQPRGARHKLPAVIPDKPGGKRTSKTESPRAGMRFPTKKDKNTKDTTLPDKTALETATKTLDLG